MKTIEAIKQRRAVKVFDPYYEMTEDEVNRLISLTQLSPTAFNQQNLRFVIVRDKALRQKIRAAANDQAQVTDASLLIIICADTKAWEKEPARYWANAGIEVQQHVENVIDKYYRGKEQVQRDEAMRSAGIAAQTMMLAAKAAAYDSCPMDGFDFEEVSTLINLPVDHVVTMFVAVGKAIEQAKPRPTQLAMSEVVVYDQF